MRKLLIMAFAANLLLTAISLAVLPDHVAIHFAGGGKPDSWAAKEFNAAIFVVLEVPFFLMFSYATLLTRSRTKKHFSIPNKDYWLRDENLPRFHQKFGRYMAEFGVAIFVFFFAIKLLTIQANLREPVLLDVRVFMIVLVIYMSYTLWWTVRIIRGFRIPVGVI
jgi:uncharacterized membrane protein